MMEKKRILFVITSLYNGGAEKSMVNLLNEIDYNRYDVDLLLFKKKGLFLGQVPKQVNILEAPKDISYLYGDKTVWNKYGLLKVVGSIAARIRYKYYDYQKAFRWKSFYKNIIDSLPGKYDIAFAGISGDVAYYVVDKVTAAKKIVMVHSDYRAANMPPMYDKPYFENADYIGSISEKCVEVLKETFPEFSPKIVLLNNIVSSNLIRKRSQEYIPEDMSNEGVRLLSVGRLSYEKGFDIAINAASILKQKGYNFHWYIIGAGKEEDSLRTEIESKNLKDVVSLLGVRENPYVYVRNCDFLIQPSRFEGKSVVLDETKILAKPIIATAYPTVNDQIVPYKEGIITPLSVEGLAEGIEYAINNPDAMEGIVNFLSSHEYGNQDEINRYYYYFNN